MNTIIKPRITEKSGLQSEMQNIYTFEVTKNSTKGSIEKEIKALYKVTPTKVRIINLPSVKKALIYLKKGDKINLT
ncbi:MAG TPA: 50S ribosomal protein L23 [Candidatus Paceibacterota bacterium]